MDAEGQVDRFMRRLQSVKEIQTQTEKPSNGAGCLKIWSIEEMELGTRASNALAAQSGDRRRCPGASQAGAMPFSACKASDQTALIKIKALHA